MVRDERRAERITMLTDFLLAVVAGGVALPLLARGGGESSALLAWGLVFLFTALAATTGGAFHGLRFRLAPQPARRLWVATLLLTAPVGFFLLVAAALDLPSQRVRASLLWLAAAKLCAVLVFLWRTAAFAVVAVDSGLSLMVVGLVAGWGVAAEERYAGGGWVLAGVLLSLVGAAVQQRRWRSDRYFDYNDFFHLCQAVACLLFYQGVGRG